MMAEPLQKALAAYLRIRLDAVLHARTNLEKVLEPKGLEGEVAVRLRAHPGVSICAYVPVRK
jgi:hypothetical protein